MVRILFVGAGGTGGYFGGRLVEAGCDVTFLVREKRAAQLRSDGLVIKSSLGNFSGKVEFVTLSELDASFDVIVLSCKAYDLASVVSDLKGRLSQTAYLLPLLNGLAHYEELDFRFGRERVMGGLCHIGVFSIPSERFTYRLRTISLYPNRSSIRQCRSCRNYKTRFARD